METSLLIFLAVFGAVILGAGVYYLLRYLKGSIKIQLNNGTQNSGELLEGNVFLKAKKQITSNEFRVHLIAYEQRVSYRQGRRRTQSYEIFRSTSILEGSKVYNSGTSISLPFKIQIPFNEQVRSSTINTGNAIANNVIKGVQMLAGSGTGTIKWYLKAELDAEGVDLKTSKKLGIVLKSQTINTSTEQSIQN